MGKKIVVITGSPRKAGNSFAMTEAFIAAAEKRGHTVTRFDAAKMNVSGCRACETCFKTGNIYILDEPTTGLHSRDIEKLLSLLRQLVAQHNTVVIVEHRLELIAQADWIIDMGPEGGSEGGEVLFCGTPDNLLSSPISKTGGYLRKAR